MKMIRWLFWFWLAIGLGLMLFYKVPDVLGFSNGLFLVFFALYAVMLERRLGGRVRGIAARAALVGAVTYLLEWVGTETGYPFGHYDYSATLRFWDGGVPLAIGFAWIGVMSCGVLLSRAATRLGKALQVGMYSVLFDLVLDPVAFHQQFWIWSSEGAWGTYYGVPLQNFAAWFVTAALLSFLYPHLPARQVREVRSGGSAAGMTALYSEAVRLYQGMHVMFGLLACKAGLWGAAATAFAVIALLEGRLRYARSTQKPNV